MKYLTIPEIHKKLSRHYSSGVGRRLFIHKSHSGNNRLGVIFFVLEGSPPKGYAMYIPGHRKTCFYDISGKRWRDGTMIDVKGYKNLPDNCIWNPQTKTIIPYPIPETYARCVECKNLKKDFDTDLFTTSIEYKCQVTKWREIEDPDEYISCKWFEEEEN